MTRAIVVFRSIGTLFSNKDTSTKVEQSGARDIVEHLRNTRLGHAMSFGE